MHVLHFAAFFSYILLLSLRIFVVFSIDKITQSKGAMYITF